MRTSSILTCQDRILYENNIKQYTNGISQVIYKLLNLYMCDFTNDIIAEFTRGNVYKLYNNLLNLHFVQILQIIQEFFNLHR
jgi:hypothetical protein